MTYASPCLYLRLYTFNHGPAASPQYPSSFTLKGPFLFVVGISHKCPHGSIPSFHDRGLFPSQKHGLLFKALDCLQLSPPLLPPSLLSSHAASSVSQLLQPYGCQGPYLNPRSVLSPPEKVTLYPTYKTMGFPGGESGKEPICQCRLDIRNSSSIPG